MDSMPFAFSVHNFISSVGADAGFAAIIGLAVLILLYFAHARETANLREEASILAERLQQAEARVAELSRPQPVSTPVPAAEGVQVTDQRAGAAGGALPFAPAGVGAPALAAATRVVPLPDRAPSAPTPAPQPAVAVAASGAATAFPAPAGASPSAAAGGPSVAAPPPSVAAGPPSVAAPPPSVAAGPPSAAAGPPSVAAPPVPDPTPGVPRPATAAGAGTAAGVGTAAGARSGAANGGGRSSVPPLGQPRPQGQRPRQLPPLSGPTRTRGGVGRRVAMGLIALVLLGAVVVALVTLTGNSTTKHSSPPVPTTNAPVATHAAVFSPASVTVAVLNGTSTNQLAHRVAAKLASSGYKEGKITTASNQTMTSTIVAYLPGAKNRADALHVATSLNLKPTAVQPVDQATQQVACPPPGACPANVIVTVGADLATL